ncbi:MAG: succinylglutamate desuccinylase/aspartoacylase family protein [Pseudomonadota bacterium]
MDASLISGITSEIDFTKDGKQGGFLRLPHSVHRSAYGWIPIPIVQIQNGEGPQVLLMSGNHGDEYEGQVALTKLCKTLEPEKMRGRILILPMANFPAAMAGTRTSPIDGGNLNREFPGNPRGTITQIIAHYIGEVLMEGMDYFLDLHSGGSSLHYLPTFFGILENEPDRSARVRQIVEALDFPSLILCPPEKNGRTADVMAKHKGALTFFTELGGSGTVTPEVLRLTEKALHDFLGLVGCIDHHPAAGEREHQPQLMVVRGAQDYCYARDVGLFEPYVELGDWVEAGQPAGAIHSPETPWAEPVALSFEAAGQVVCKRIPGRVQRGDCLFHLSAPE